MSEGAEFHANDRLTDISFDQSIGRSTPDVEHERAVAIFDLLEKNCFKPVGEKVPSGPYLLKLAVIDGKLVFVITLENGADVATHILSLGPFRRIVRDYYMICESYYEAIKTASITQIETIDMARRGVHNDGSETLQKRLEGKILVDFDTARRLFTLVCVLHWRG
ncbi:MAG: UPF0262 family protein [Ahrensia sp.]|nr:UPF0262 family protein [Ahrensia sp.]